MSKQAKIYRQAPLWTPGRPRHTPVYPYPYPYPSFRSLASPNDRPHVSIAAEAAGRNGKNRLPRLLLRVQVNNKTVASSVPLLSVVGHAYNINDQTSTAVVGHRSLLHKRVRLRLTLFYVLPFLSDNPARNCIGTLVPC